MGQCVDCLFVSEVTDARLLHNNAVSVRFHIEHTHQHFVPLGLKKLGGDLLWGLAGVRDFRVRPKLGTVKGEKAMPDELHGLRFPCECVSAQRGGYSDPWADITKRKLLPNGTKEEILNLVAREPKTISQLAVALNLSAPSVHTHINEMIRSELLRESKLWEKKYPIERYYEPNFPVFKAEECQEFRALCEVIAEQMAKLFERKRAKMERAFKRTELANQGWKFSDITQCLFANVQRSARAVLEQRGLLTPRQKHANGAEWIFWAEEPEPD
jgi:DNA-binding transcriptional ArsR family regulator